MRLNTNMMSLSAFRNYTKSINQNSSALEKISSGKKINSAKDEPHKLGQSERIKLQLRGIEMAEVNLQAGASMMQTFDSGIGNINGSLIRMRELAVQAGNDTCTDDDKATIQAEIEQLKSHIDYTSKNTEFNGVKLIGDETVIDNNNPNSISMASGANKGDAIFIPKYNLSSDMLKDSKGNSIKDIDFINGDIDTILNTIDESMVAVSSVASKYGALQNRFESQSEIFASNSMMLSRASGNIEGADIAKEMMEFTRTNILIEAGIAMVAQSNQIPNDALRVLERVR